MRRAVLIARGPVGVAALIVCAVAGLDGRASAQEPDPAAPQYSVAYLAAVRDYRAGRFDRAMSALLEIDHTDIEKTLAWLAGRYRNLVPETIVEREARALEVHWKTADVKAAAVAHVDLGFRLTESNALRDRHFDDAARLLDIQHLGPRKSAPHFILSAEIRRNCYLGMVLHMQYLGDLWGVAEWLDRAVPQFPEDPALTLARGTLAEAFAWEGRNLHRAPSARLPRRLWSLAEMPNKDVLAQAEADFRRVLSLDPASDEATLRLGRVLAERESHKEALAVLNPLLLPGRDPWLEYLARLFAGGACQGLGRHDEAIARYTEAIALQPGAQSAKVALSHAQRQAGRLPASVASAEEAFSIRADRWYDPWLEYHHGQSRHLGDLLERLRKEAVR